MLITLDCLPGAEQTAQTVNCCELTRDLTQAGAVCGQTLLLGASYWVRRVTDVLNGVL